jgi:hypothetical protein
MLHPRADYNDRIQDTANKIPANEPVVLLRAQDKLAIWPLRLYVLLCRIYQAKPVADRIAKHIKLMRKWPKKKTPDVPSNV